MITGRDKLLFDIYRRAVGECARLACRRGSTRGIAVDSDVSSMLWQLADRRRVKALAMLLGEYGWPDCPECSNGESYLRYVSRRARKIKKVLREEHGLVHL